jgi:hypothetical protein
MGDVLCICEGPAVDHRRVLQVSPGPSHTYLVLLIDLVSFAQMGNSAQSVRQAADIASCCSFQISWNDPALRSRAELVGEHHPPDVSYGMPLYDLCDR